MRQVGVITELVIQILNLKIAPNTPIYIGDTNIAHMLAEHEQDYGRYGNLIEEIIAAPTYVGYKKGSIEYVKEVAEYIKVAVRVSSDGTYFARTLYTMNSDKVDSMVAKGFLFPLT